MHKLNIRRILILGSADHIQTEIKIADFFSVKLSKICGLFQTCIFLII